MSEFAHVFLLLIMGFLVGCVSRPPVDAYGPSARDYRGAYRVGYSIHPRGPKDYYAAVFVGTSEIGPERSQNYAQLAAHEYCRGLQRWATLDNAGLMMPNEFPEDDEKLNPQVSFYCQPRYLTIANIHMKNDSSGVLISDVSPFFQSQLMNGDVLVSLNHVKIVDWRDIGEVAQSIPLKSVPAEVLRGGKRLRIFVALYDFSPEVKKEAQNQIRAICHKLDLDAPAFCKTAL